MKRFSGLSQVVLLPEHQKGVSETIKKDKLEMKMIRAILCAAVLASASVTLSAQTVPGFVTINGGKNTVALHVSPPSETSTHVKPPLVPFYSDFATGNTPYNCGQSYTVSELGSSVGAEVTPAAQFVPVRTGASASIKVAVGWLAGLDSAWVVLDNDCGGAPCGVDSENLCHGNITNMPKFSTSCTAVETINCKAQIVKGWKYWVYVVAPKIPGNTWDGWYYSATPTLGTIGVSTNDGAWAVTKSQPLPAFSVQ